MSPLKQSTRRGFKFCSVMRWSVVSAVGVQLTIAFGCTSWRVPAIANGGSSTLVARSGRLFDFHSDPWVNLHHFLYNSARARSAGAYGTAPPRHVAMSSIGAGYKDARGLEMLFHEASHTIADSLATVLRQLAAAAGKPAPFGVLHPIIFFTAGELTQRTVSGYVPFAESAGMWRGRMGIYLPAIQRHWRPHMQGRQTLREALRAILSDL